MLQYGEDEIKQKYTDILKYVKLQGCKVIHVKFKDKTLGGTFSAYRHKEIICIDKNLKYTLDGCFTLLHEFGHARQSRGGKFKKFIKLETGGKYSDEKMELIIGGEQDASAYATKLLQKRWNISYLSEDLTEDGLKECIKYWRKYFFKD